MKMPCCRFCHAILRHTFVNLGMSPLANAYLTPAQLHQMEPFYPLHVYVCERCFLVQLEEFASPEQIFSDYAYFASYSDTWLSHARSYVEMANARFKLNDRSQVVEIASNDGYLLQYFVARGTPVLGIEPAANVAETAVAKGIPTRVEFFGEDMARRLVGEGIQADLIVGNNVLAHVPKLNNFVRGLKILLKPHGAVTLEFPHLLRLIAENQFDTIYHEHFCYFSLITVERLFAAHGLTIFDVEELSTHGGSLRIYAGHAEATSETVGPRIAELKASEEAAGLTHIQTYCSYAERVQDTKCQLLSFLIEAKRRGKSIVGYGAAAKGTTLLNYCGIRSDFIDYTVDRSPHKQGRFLPGTHLPIHQPEKVKETKPDYLLILPWNLTSEIVAQMEWIREWGGQFIVPIPEVRVIA
jgi:2-polyprenyl-3-methyl-5-hydroxy-6-metoxy-1,4-benzoquinol methylase